MLPIIFMDLVDESDIPAFEEMYESNKEIAYSRAYKILINSALAEECVSDVFLALAKNFQKVNKLSADEQRKYIVICVRNRAINIISKEQRELTNFEYNDAILSKDANTDLGLFELKELVRNLKQTDIEIIYLVSILGFTYKEIASSYGIGYSAVKQRFFRAKKNLEKLLTEEGETNDQKSTDSASSSGSV